MNRSTLKDSKKKKINVEDDVDCEASIDNIPMQFFCGDTEKERSYRETKESRR
jgi:hypothetical protein